MSLICHFSSSSLHKPSFGHASFHPYIVQGDSEKDRIVEEYFNSLPKKIQKILPNPNKYKINQSIQVGSHLVLMLQYDACTYYEGKKVLVFKDISLTELLERNRTLIDPHFNDDSNFISPVARFEPTDEGWKMAIQFAKKIL